MKQHYYKVFWAWESEKEEQWLNKMSAKGLQLTQVSLFDYTFTEGAPGEYIYRLELLEEMPSAQKSRDYLRFLKETGVEHISSMLRWVYLRRPAAEGPFDLYSDITSQVKQNSRILALLVIACAMLLFSVFTLWNGHQQVDSPLQPVFMFFSGAMGLLVFSGLLRVINRRRKLLREQRLRE